MSKEAIILQYVLVVITLSMYKDACDVHQLFLISHNF